MASLSRAIFVRADEVQLLNTGEILGPSGIWAVLTGGSSSRSLFENHGKLGDSSTSTALTVSSFANDTVFTITNTGDMIGTTAVSSSSVDMHVFNGGTIIADNNAFDVQSLNLENGGEIVGNVTSNHLNIHNDGLISATRLSGGGQDDAIINNGEIYGEVTLFDGDNKIVNYGVLEGRVNLGNDDDQLTNTGLTQGNIFFNRGDDMLINTGTHRGDIYKHTSPATDTLQLENTGHVLGTVTSAATTILQNSGTIDGAVLLGNGDDEIRNTGNGQITGMINAGYGNDVIATGKAGAIVDAGHGNDRIWASAGENEFFGAWGNDYLGGGTGQDTLNGGSDHDTILGNGGADQLTGGSGKDVFVFTHISDSSFGAHDTITDFTRGDDTIDLSRVLQASNTKVQNAANGSWIDGNVTGAADPDFQIFVEGVTNLTLGDLTF